MRANVIGKLHWQCKQSEHGIGECERVPRAPIMAVLSGLWTYGYNSSQGISSRFHRTVAWAGQAGENPGELNRWVSQSVSAGLMPRHAPVSGWAYMQEEASIQCQRQADSILFYSGLLIAQAQWRPVAFLHLLMICSCIQTLGSPWVSQSGT